MSRQILSEPSTAFAEDGLVLLDGPDGIAATLTPEAAMALADALVPAARTALEQRERAAGAVGQEG